ncbi:MAG: PAS domain-containing protein [Nitrospirota bacterium]
MPIRYQTLPAIILALILAALVTGAVILRVVENRLIGAAGENLALAAVDIAEKLDLVLAERYGDIQMMVQADVMQGHDVEAMTVYLRQLQKAYPIYLWLGVTDAQGRIVAATDQTSVGGDRSRATWFQAVRGEHRIRVLDVEESEEVERGLAASFAAPIIGPRGEFRGAVVTQIGLSSLEDATVFPMQVQQGTAERVEYQFLTQDGTVIVDSALRQEGTVNLKRARLPSAELFDSAPPGYVEEQHLRRHVPVITGYARTRGSGEFAGLSWGVLVRRDRQDVLAPIHDVLWKFGAAMGLVFLPAVGFLIWTTGRLKQEWAKAQSEQRRATEAEVAAQEKARLLELLFNDSLTCLVLLDRNFNFIRVNEAYARACRRKVSEFPGHNHFEFYPSDAQKIFEQVRETKKPFQTFARPFVFPDHPEWGVTYWDWTLVPILDRSGEVEFLVFSLNDVTERERAEENLAKNRAQLEAILDNSPTMIFLKDPEGRYLLSNRQFEKITHRPSEAILGRTDEDIFPPEQAAAFRANDRRVLDAGVPLLFEEVALHDDGPHTSLVCKFPLRDSQGRVHAIGGIVTDITERKLAEEALRRSEASLANAQRIAHLGNWDWNIVTNELRWSDEIYRIFGLTPQEFGATYEAFLGSVHPDDREHVKQAVNDALYRHAPYGIDHRIVLPDGTVRTVHEQAEVTFDAQGRPIRMMGTVQDITEQRRLEEQLRQAQKMEAIGRLAGGIAHDFNNLLTVINGYCQLLLSDMRPLDPRYRHVQEIFRAGERATALTNQLLTFSRKQILHPRVLDLNEVVANVERMLARLIGENIRLVTRLDPALWPVRAEPGQIEQVLLNLAVNARDAMPRGGIVTIETANEELTQTAAPLDPTVPPGPYTRLTVTDTGCGMDEATQARIFEPFFTTKEPGKGTGLGLSTVYGIVKQSGGYIFVRSKPGQGTTFTVYLPRVEEPVLRETHESPAVPADGGSEIILLVEDQAEVRALTRTILHSKGYAVLEASDGEQALRLCRERQGPLHLLLADVMLPGMDGLTLAERLTALRPDMKVLYMSGYADDALRRRGALSESNAFLQKPFTPPSLIRKVREVLDAPPNGQATATHQTVR